MLTRQPALAVGKDRMGQDAVNMVQLLGNIQQNITETDDPQSSYLLHCWGRMCRVLGQDFLPYLPGVIPPLMELASAKADIQLLDDEEQVAQIESEEGWELVPLKGKFIGIKTATLDDKHTAIELISIYAEHLKASFEPYVLEIMDKITLPSLEFFFHDPVRVAAAKAIPQLLNSYKLAHGEASNELAGLWSRTIERILAVLSTEPAIDTLSEMYQCFYESIEVMGKDCLSTHHLSTFIDSAKLVLEDYQKRVAERAAESPNATTNGAPPDEDAEEEDEDVLLAIEDDQTLLSDMNKAFHTCMKHHVPTFLTFWERLLPLYSAFVNSPDATQRQWALCIYDDVLEFAGPQSWSYHDAIIQPLVTGIRDSAPANRQAAAYGAGVAASKGGEQWADFCAGVLPLLFECCARPDARTDEHVYATENACAAIAKICKFNASKLSNTQEVVAHWLDTLPITNDEEAAPFAYSFLAELVDGQNAAVLEVQRVPGLFRAVALALEAETVQGQTATRVVEAMKRLVSLPGVDTGGLTRGLAEETQRSVGAWFS